ncbi:MULTISPECIES: GvpL/GvpF family gas vesicle protein [Streptomyces]|uniref:GvpL/GvpF family gas vesicle protein n=1 Tax=Streptomyces TaxID=1883 RepID=UPI00287F78D3|nr:GvpL/GvpF family gas vesicle protein [Streptomyces sp. CGMCC 4.1456]WNF65836.1 GvpL/GvpF family gas vesicle protein [Streptomyces sp. CGMCC 4.1456]
MTDPNLVYTYAVLRRTPEATAAVTHLRGVAGEPIHLVDPAEGTPQLAFAVGHVPAADYDETPLKAHLDDLDWLESTVRSHHAVVAALVGCGAAVLPLRLATVYHDEDRARQALDTRRDYFLSLLHRLTGHVELGVKIYATPDITPPEADTGAGQEQPTGLGAGRAYLSIRRRRQRRNEEAWRRVAQAAAHLTETAATLAVDRVAHSPQRGSLAGPGPGTNVGNDAYLVPAGRVDAFRAGILAVAEGVPGLRVEVTGPWAPYSFALQPEPEPAA